MTTQTILVLLVLAVVVGAGVLLALVRNPRTATFVESLFRRPPKPARTPGSSHYYKPYWS
jgi:hypothetical protein